VGRTGLERAGEPGRHRWPALADGVPTDLEPLLREAGATHLPMLAANAAAFAAGRATHEFAAAGVAYRGVPTSRYRVWALDRLRRAYLDLTGEPRAATERLLAATGCLEPLLAVERLDSGHDPDGRAPFSRVARMVRD
jgi:hypothetical protein